MSKPAFIVKSAILIALMCVASGCAAFKLGPTIAPLKEKVISGHGPEKVLVLDINGLINNQEKRAITGHPIQVGMVEKVREILTKAEQDKRIKALLVRVNSPGGTVTSSDIIYHEIQAYKERTNTRVYVSILDMAASGGYYIAMAGDKIVGHPTSLTGSIGVIAFKVNLEGLLDKVGVDWEVVKSADKKDFLSPLRRLTVEERKLFQSTINSYHERFLEIIAENRPGLDLKAVRTLADGRVFTADKALEAQLIDSIGYMDQTLDTINVEMGLADPKVVTYHRPGEYKSNLYSSMPASPTINMINIDLGLNLETTSPHFMYLWMP